MNKPEIASNSGLLWEAYQALHSSRQYGMAGPQPIMLGEIMAYCAIVGMVDPQERLELLFIMQAMDGEYFRYLAEERAKAGPAT